MSVYDPNTAAGQNWNRTVNQARLDEERRQQKMRQQAAFQSNDHYNNFLNWANRNYGGKYDYGYYLTGKRTSGLIDPQQGNVWLIAKNQYDYGGGNGTYKYASDEYEPTDQPSKVTETWNEYLKTHSAGQFSQDDWSKEYTRQEYKGKYGDTAEDKAAYTAGQAPMRVQYSQKILDEYDRLAKASQAGTLTYVGAQKMAPTLFELTKAAKDAEAARQADTANGKAPAATVSWSGIKAPSNTDWMDYDLLKKMGYDKKNGFSGILDPIRNQEQDLVNAYIAQGIPPNEAVKRVGSIAVKMQGGTPFIDALRQDTEQNATQALLLQAQPKPEIPEEILKQYDIKNVVEKKRNEDLGFIPITSEEYVKAVENKDEATIQKYARQRQLTPVKPHFTDDQFARLFQASEQWTTMPDWAKSTLSFALGAADSLATVPFVGMVPGVPYGGNALEMTYAFKAQRGDEQAAKSLAALRTLRQADPEAYGYGQLAAMAVPAMGVDMASGKIPKKFRIANEAEEQLGCDAEKLIEQINKADMDLYVGTPLVRAQRAEATLIRTNPGLLGSVDEVKRININRRNFETYSPEEHIIPCISEKGQTNFYVTDIKGNRLGAYEKRADAASAARKYRTEIGSNRYPMPKFRSYPLDKAIASDNIGNMLRGVETLPEGSIKNAPVAWSDGPMPKPAARQITPKGGIAYNSELEGLELRPPETAIYPKTADSPGMIQIQERAPKPGALSRSGENVNLPAWSDAMAFEPKAAYVTPQGDVVFVPAESPMAFSLRKGEQIPGQVGAPQPVTMTGEALRRADVVNSARSGAEAAQTSREGEDAFSRALLENNDGKPVTGEGKAIANEENNIDVSKYVAIKPKRINYRKIFFEKYPQYKGKVVVHHAIEQHVLRKFKGLFTEKELNEIESLRGIPKELNSKIHLSEIRKIWSQFYDNIQEGTIELTRESFFKIMEEIDNKFGHLFYPPIR